ncbi:hypothetical protein LY76DRAFT_362055 [Colletotrichum caudatum]|nr:hypothetical protein LY76DRAFT_362055 [Colletotrichum caudatum]
MWQEAVSPNITHCRILPTRRLRCVVAKFRGNDTWGLLCLPIVYFVTSSYSQMFPSIMKGSWLTCSLSMSRPLSPLRDHVFEFSFFYNFFFKVSRTSVSGPDYSFISLFSRQSSNSLQLQQCSCYFPHFLMETPLSGCQKAASKMVPRLRH